MTTKLKAALKDKLTAFLGRPTAAQVIRVALLAALLATVLMVALLINQDPSSPLARGTALIALLAAAIKGIELATKESLAKAWSNPPDLASARIEDAVNPSTITKTVIEKTSYSFAPDGTYTSTSEKIMTTRKTSS